MKRITSLVFLTAFAASALFADDQTRAVQQQLKDQGFYYGQIDGQSGSETTAAIRRFQIRNGLQVTGTLTKETLDALNAPGNPVQPAGAAPLPPQPAPLDQQPQGNAPDSNTRQSDQDFLKQQQQPQPQEQQPPPPPPQQPAPPAPTAVAPPPPESQDNPNVVAPPVNVPPQASVLEQQYEVLYRHTPYETAPVVVQQGTLKNAQFLLSSRQYYTGEVDGIPGPATARAITLYQNQAGIAPSGRLDLDTLAAMHLLPNSRNVHPPVVAHPRPHPQIPPPVVLEPFYPNPPPPPRVYRGVWVN